MGTRTFGDGAFSNNYDLTVVNMSAVTGNVTFGTGVFANSPDPDGSSNLHVTLDESIFLNGHYGSYYRDNANTVFPPDTIFTIRCFLEGTLILTPSGYKPIESLKKDDLITTLDGDKPMTTLLSQTIHHDASAKRNAKQLFSMTYPCVFQPLIMTGAHSTLVTPTPNQNDWIQSMPDFKEPVYGFYRFPAALDENAKIYEITGDYKVYNIVIGETFEGIFANGLLVETCVVY